MSTLSTWDSVERLSYWLSIIRWLPDVTRAITVIAAVAAALVLSLENMVTYNRGPFFLGYSLSFHLGGGGGCRGGAHT